MKNLLVLIAVVLMLAFPAFAQDVDIQGPHHTLGIGSNAQAGAASSSTSSAGATSSSSSGVINNIGNGFGNFSPSSRASLDFDYHSFDFQGQFGYVAPVQEVNVDVPRQFVPSVPQIGEPQINPLINGAIGSAKDLLPKFAYAGLQWLSNEEGILDSRTFNSSPGMWPAFLDRICLEDLEPDILALYRRVIKETGWKEGEVRLRVFFKPKSKGIGGGSQGNGTGSWLPSNPSAYAGGIAGIVGYNSSTVDNTYTVKFYRIYTGSGFQKLTEADYKVAWWKRVEESTSPVTTPKRIIFGKEIVD